MGIWYNSRLLGANIDDVSTMKTWDTVAIVGVGLLGGSIGLALRRRKLARRVIGIGRRPAKLRTARSMGAVTQTTTDVQAGVAEAELVVVCTPVDQVAELSRQAAWHGAKGVLVTDVGSTKEAIVHSLDQALARHNPRQAAFVGSHPMAGSEKQGPQHARADLFEGRVVVVTPSPATPARRVQDVQRLWRSLGATVVRSTPKAHDQAVAAASHVPHLMAAVLAGTTPPEALRIAAGGWLDTTRIASGDPALWTQILSQNRFNVLESLGQVEASLAEFRRALVYNDIPLLRSLLERGKKVRDGRKQS
jgi:prephenate dehydrogenase